MSKKAKKSPTSFMDGPLPGLDLPGLDLPGRGLYELGLPGCGPSGRGLPVHVLPNGYGILKFNTYSAI